MVLAPILATILTAAAVGLVAAGTVRAAREVVDWVAEGVRGVWHWAWHQPTRASTRRSAPTTSPSTTQVPPRIPPQPHTRIPPRTPPVTSPSTSSSTSPATTQIPPGTSRGGVPGYPEHVIDERRRHRSFHVSFGKGDPYPPTTTTPAVDPAAGTPDPPALPDPGTSGAPGTPATDPSAPTSSPPEPSPTVTGPPEVETPDPDGVTPPENNTNPAPEGYTVSEINVPNLPSADNLQQWLANGQAISRLLADMREQIDAQAVRLVDQHHADGESLNITGANTHWEDVRGLLAQAIAAFQRAEDEAQQAAAKAEAALRDLIDAAEKAQGQVGSDMTHGAMVG